MSRSRIKRIRKANQEIRFKGILLARASKIILDINATLEKEIVDQRVEKDAVINALRNEQEQTKAREELYRAEGAKWEQRAYILEHGISAAVHDLLGDADFLTTVSTLYALIGGSIPVTQVAIKPTTQADIVERAAGKTVLFDPGPETGKGN